jgi:hypothetical protein
VDRAIFLDLNNMLKYKDFSIVKMVFGFFGCNGVQNSTLDISFDRDLSLWLRRISTSDRVAIAIAGRLPGRAGAPVLFCSTVPGAPALSRKAASPWRWPGDHRRFLCGDMASKVPATMRDHWGRLTLHAGPMAADDQTQ